MVGTLDVNSARRHGISGILMSGVVPWTEHLNWLDADQRSTADHVCLRSRCK